MTSENNLRLESVSVGTLEAVSVSVAAGEVVGLSGPSGSGKTRLLRAIADLDSHGGSIWLGETEQRALPAHQWRRRVMLVPAESQWWFERVGEHFPADLDPSALPALGLAEEALDWPVSRLSSGEKQRLALLRAVTAGPRALLLDEPTTNLDAEAVARTERWLLKYIRRERLPVLWVAHDLEQLQRIADRHVCLDGASMESR